VTAAVLEDVQALTLDELAALFYQDDEGRAAALAEAGRRDRAEQRKRAREAERAEWELAAHAQYLDADRVCKGRLLGRRGLAAGITERELWSGPAARAWSYASDELREYWDACPRIPPVTAYRAGLAADRRAERAEAERERLEDAEDTAEDEVTEQVAAAEPIAVAATTEPPAEKTDSPRRYPMTSFAAIVPSAPAWLWPGRIPAGEVTLLAGPCGVGKSFVTADVAGRVSRGDPMPGGLDGRAPGSGSS
jgi:AAA domain